METREGAGRRRARPSFALGPVKVRAGSRKEVSLPISRLVTGAEVSLPVHVLHGREDGPTVWVSAAIHGDEVVGIEVVRRVMGLLDPKQIRGTLIAVPIVNVIGVMTGDRYLPDRRDLNRSFPGSARGPLAGRIAHLLMTEVVSRCDVGIDLHTAADRRTNLPQIRCDLEDPQTRFLAEAFAAPVLNHARLRDGSLRWAAREAGARVLLYEGGEAWRFDEWAIQPGVEGVLRVLAALEMIPAEQAPSPPEQPSAVCWTSGWVRARRDGLLQLDVPLGQTVAVGDRLGALYDSFGRRQATVKADRPGIVIGRAEAPLVHRGDALVHIAQDG
ncbi:succinylglutamate desuccinylase/aspartoacylase family protein [Micrococcus terreus]|uniref:succinylglutamate desuccinylase/aspartoacylase family protein n=1 Tax=Micrococcus terreus TaxID=574650 RepID=UPI0021A901C8|nr:succinylglutamate desuccinylase/aspartoacylase family protein [Micrococcus terreus]MCT2088478.1 succinylglutamate desuccinylase/aspartoacylase family protein [Micrococcus terreus]